MGNQLSSESSSKFIVDETIMRKLQKQVLGLSEVPSSQIKFKDINVGEFEG